MCHFWPHPLLGLQAIACQQVHVSSPKFLKSMITPVHSWTLEEGKTFLSSFLPCTQSTCRISANPARQSIFANSGYLLSLTFGQTRWGLFDRCCSNSAATKIISRFTAFVASFTGGTQLICEMSGTFIDTKYKGYQKLLAYIFHAQNWSTFVKNFWRIFSKTFWGTFAKNFWRTFSKKLLGYAFTLSLQSPLYPTWR